MADHADSSPVAPGLGADLSTLALISLGSTEAMAGAHDDSKQHLERGIELARRIGRPYLEFRPGLPGHRELLVALACLGR